jgi:hypothetical protein
VAAVSGGARQVGVVDCAVRNRPIAGESVSGDGHVAAAFPHGVLLGLIDGLGHGQEAAAATRVAVATLEAEPDRPVLALIRACHVALRGTRGAVMSLAAIDAARDEMAWAGVGNVEAVLTRAEPAAGPARARILLRSGVVGYQLPPLRAVSLPIAPGDLLVFASDGLGHGFGDEAPFGDPGAFAEHLLRVHGRSSDDASVLVARYRGAPP